MVENLRGLQSLYDLTLSSNRITDAASLIGLIEAPSIASVSHIQLDLSGNSVDMPGNLLEILSRLPNLGILSLKENNLIRQIANYRKVLVCRLTSLKYLDDRPISEVDRQAFEAWETGGRESELAVRRQLHEASERKRLQNHEHIRKLERDGIRLRREAIAKLQRERNEEIAQIELIKQSLAKEQPPDLEQQLASLEARQADLMAPIEEEGLVKPALPEGKIVVRQGDFDVYGDPIAAESYVEQTVDPRMASDRPVSPSQPS